MPETPMDKYNFFQARENQIGLGGKVFSMKAIAEAQFMNDFSHNQFRLGIPPANMRHALAALFRGKDINHKF